MQMYIKGTSMKGCFNKCCFSVIGIGILAAWLLLANMKPDLLKNSFASFIDMLQFKKTEKTTQKTYIRKDSRYIEPSAFGQDQ
jgi:hypothetical protein